MKKIILTIICLLAILCSAVSTHAEEKQEKWYPFNDGNKCTITAYCLCEKCCGSNWQKNKTANGATPKRWYTCANGSLPFGTVVYIEGVGYRTVQDRGSAVTDTSFDIYAGVQNHQVAKDFGKKKRRVWIVKWQ